MVYPPQVLLSHREGVEQQTRGEIAYQQHMLIRHDSHCAILVVGQQVGHNRGFAALQHALGYQGGDETGSSFFDILGTKRALVVHGSGMDEISNTGETRVVALNGGKITKYSLTPEKLGVKRASAGDIAGGTPEENARDIVDVLKGKKGSKRDIVVFNSAFALYAADIVGDVKQGIKLAEKSIDSGSAKQILEKLVKETQKYD